MKKILLTLLVLSALMLTACSGVRQQEAVTSIQLSDDKITVNGSEISTEKGDVYLSRDIVFYLENQGEAYGEGEKWEEHPQSEADKHSVINITRPGEYIISGSLSHGQIAVKLGDTTDSKNKVNITLDNADITCTVAPAIICYSAYECGDYSTDKATKDTDTSNAGFSITLAEGSTNNINGSHVARIFDENGKKLHKYDAAIETLVSMNIGGEGTLNVTSDNEGIETKLHMTINGGAININSADDSLNAGEDGVSVITINGGNVYCNSNNGSEGDGIDSNGWLVINGGNVSAFANSNSMDSGLDSDNGIYINGGNVFATGNMYDTVREGETQNTVVFTTAEKVAAGEFLLLKDSSGNPAIGFTAPADYSVMVYSSGKLAEGGYTLYKAAGITSTETNGVYTDITATEGEIQLAHSGSGAARPGMGGRPGDFNPGNMGDMPQMPEGFKPENMPEDFDRGKMPEGFEKGDRQYNADMGNPPEKPRGEMPDRNFEKDENGRPMGFGGEGGFDFDQTTKQNPVFTVTKGISSFGGITRYKPE